MSPRADRPDPAEGTGDRDAERCLEPLPDGVTDRVLDPRPVIDDRGVGWPEPRGDGAALVLLRLAAPLFRSSPATCLGAIEASTIVYSCRSKPSIGEVSLTGTSEEEAAAAGDARGNVFSGTAGALPKFAATDGVQVLAAVLSGLECRP